MSERRKTHNGRRLNGKFKVRQEDVDDKLADPNGATYVADDVRLGGAVADTGPDAGRRAAELQHLIDQDRASTAKFRRW